jgi:hypothetical protein
MNSRISSSIKNLVQKRCQVLGINFTKTVYRRAKKLYKSLPVDKQEDFFKYFNIK